MTLKEQIEKLMDTHGLTAIVDSICEVCYEKAEHIRSSYSDEYLAERWEKAGVSLVNPAPEHQHPDGFPS